MGETGRKDIRILKTHKKKTNNPIALAIIILYSLCYFYGQFIRAIGAFCIAHFGVDESWIGDSPIFAIARFKKFYIVFYDW